MRRMWAASAAIVLCLALGGLPAAGQESSEQPSAASTTIGFTNVFQDDGFFSDIEAGAREAAAAAGVDLLVETAWGSPTTQANHVRGFIEKGVDAIIITPVDPDAIVASVEAANAAGIPLLAVDRTASGGTVASLIASDNVAGGRMAGEFLFETMGGAGKVVEIQGDMAVSSGARRSEGFQEALDAAPGITRVVQAPAYFEYGMALRATQQALEEDPDIGGVFAANLGMLYGAIEGVSAAGMEGQVRVVGFDTEPDILAMVKDGSIDATVAQQPRLMGQKAVEAAIAAAAGETVEPFIPIETILVTADNVDQFLAGEVVAAEAAQDEPATDPTALVTGSMLWQGTDPSQMEFSEEGPVDQPGSVGHGRGLKHTAAYEWSDSRLPSQGEGVTNFEAYGESGVAISSTWLLEGPDGYWTGPWSGYCDAQDRCRGLVVLTGHGAYEGLYAVLAERTPEEASRVRSVFEGGIYFGTMPPPPESLEPTTE